MLRLPYFSPGATPAAFARRPPAVRHLRRALLRLRFSVGHSRTLSRRRRTRSGGAAMTILITGVADRCGRRALLVAGAALMALAGCVFAVSDEPIFLALAAVVGTISPSGKEVGPFLSLEQAILPETTEERQRTAVFSAYNLVA